MVEATVCKIVDTGSIPVTTSLFFVIHLFWEGNYCLSWISVLIMMLWRML